MRVIFSTSSLRTPSATGRVSSEQRNSRKQSDEVEEFGRGWRGRLLPTGEAPAGTREGACASGGALTDRTGRAKRVSTRASKPTREGACAPRIQLHARRRANVPSPFSHSLPGSRTAFPDSV